MCVPTKLTFANRPHEQWQSVAEIKETRYWICAYLPCNFIYTRMFYDHVCRAHSGGQRCAERYAAAATKGSRTPLHLATTFGSKDVAQLLKASAAGSSGGRRLRCKLNSKCRRNKRDQILDLR